MVAAPVHEARSIDIRDNRFEPADATVVPGTTLMWINYDQVQHTVTADDGQFDSGHSTLGTSYGDRRRIR